MFVLPFDLNAIIAATQNALLCAQNNAILTHGIMPTVTCDCTCVPYTGKAIHAMFKNAQNLNTPFFVLWSSDKDSILGHENNLYRFIHDIDHAQYFEKGVGTTKLKDELFLNMLMCKRIHNIILNKTGNVVLASKVFILLYHDLIGQALYYNENGDFVENQMFFTLSKLQNDFYFCCVDNPDTLALYVLDLIDSVNKRIVSLANVSKSNM